MDDDCTQQTLHCLADWLPPCGVASARCTPRRRALWPSRPQRMETWSCFVYLVEPWDMASERLIKSLDSTERIIFFVYMWDQGCLVLLLLIHTRPRRAAGAQERHRGGWNFTLNYHHHVYMHISYIELDIGDQTRSMFTFQYYQRIYLVHKCIKKMKLWRIKMNWKLPDL